MTEIRWPTAADIAIRLTEIRDEYADPCSCPGLDACGDCEECAAGIRCSETEPDHDDDGCEARIDVRLQVYPPDSADDPISFFSWAIRWGLSDYDQDHRGFWGSSSVALGDTPEEIAETAADLLEQAKDHHAQAEG